MLNEKEMLEVLSPELLSGVDKDSIVRGQEWLYHKFIPVPGTDSVNASIAIDGGSTAIRGTILVKGDKPTKATEVTIIPSSLRVIPSKEELDSDSDLLYSKLDTQIKFVEGSDKRDSSLFEEVRIIRGEKLINFSGISSGQKLSTAIRKTDSDIFYMNIIDGIGYTIMNRFKESVPRNVNVMLGIALPPEDLKNTRFIDKFMNNLKGKYVWRSLEYGISITINIIDTVSATEAEAQGKGFAMFNRKKLEGFTSFIDVGGRSAGLELFNGQSCLRKMSATSPICGTKFARQLNDLILNSEDNNITSDLDQESLRKAMRYGYVKIGNRNKIDVLPLIIEECKAMAEELRLEYISKVIEPMGFRVDSANIGTIYLSGGTVQAGEYGLEGKELKEIGEVSVARFFRELIVKDTGVSEVNGEILPNVEVLVIKDNYVAQGLCILTYMSPGVKDFINSQFVNENKNKLERSYEDTNSETEQVYTETE